MPTRLRKLIGGVVILAFLFFYVGLVALVADHLPDGHLIKLGFFVISGAVWGVPLIPLIAWMNRGN